MSAVVDKVERMLTESYSVQNYLDLMVEIFDGLQVVAPYNPRKEYTNFSSHIESFTHVGNYVSPDNKKIIVMAVELKSKTYVENSRSTQRSYAKKLIESANADAAMIAFYMTGDQRWRLSFVRLDYEMKIENGKLKAAENLTPAKRYSFLVGKDEPCHTAIERFRLFLDHHDSKPTLDDIENAEIKEEKIINARHYHTITEVKNGEGPHPIKTKEGWLHLAHGVRACASGLRYVLYLYMTSLEDPTKVIAEPGGYFLVPQGEEYIGDVMNVTFANGWIADDDGKVFIYYASSDTRMHVATSTIDKLIDYCKNTPEDGLTTASSVEKIKALIAKNSPSPVTM